MVSAAGAREVFPAFLYVYVEDADATFQRALDAGAVSLEAVWDTPYGDRRGMMRDPWGTCGRSPLTCRGKIPCRRRAMTRQTHMIERLRMPVSDSDLRALAQLLVDAVESEAA